MTDNNPEMPSILITHEDGDQASLGMHNKLSALDKLTVEIKKNLKKTKTVAVF